MSDANEPARPDQGEPDSDQLPIEDTLLNRGVDDVLDEGYSPPDHPRGNHWGETPLEEVLGEGIDRRLTQEEPEVWEQDHTTTPAREADRAGRLAADDASGGFGSQSVVADDVGVAGGGASAEEAAMHLVPDDEQPTSGTSGTGSDPSGTSPWEPDTDTTSDDDDLSATDR